MIPLFYMMLFHYHTVAEPYSKTDLDHRYSAAVRDTKVRLLREKLIEPAEICGHAILTRSSGMLGDPTDDIYVTTARGNALVKHICALPLPVEHTEWRMP